MTAAEREQWIEAVETAFGDADFRVTSDLTSPAHREAAAALAVDVVLPLVLAEVQEAIAAEPTFLMQKYPDTELIRRTAVAERVRQIGGVSQ